MSVGKSPIAGFFANNRTATSINSLELERNVTNTTFDTEFNEGRGQKHLELIIIIALIILMLFLVLRFLRWIFLGGFKPSEEEMEGNTSANVGEVSVSAMSTHEYLSSNVTSSRIQYGCDWSDRELLNLQRCTW